MKLLSRLPLAALLLSASCAAGAAESLDRIIAVVNDTVILQSELETNFYSKCKLQQIFPF